MKRWTRPTWRVRASTDGDGRLTPVDALLVINEVARRRAANPESVDRAVADWFANATDDPSLSRDN